MDRPLDQAARIIEVERAQIGHEIHDALLPLIFAASASVGSLLDQSAKGVADEAVNPTGQQQRLQQIAAWLDQAMQTGRRLLTEVYPPELDGANWTHVAAETVDRLLGPASSVVSWEADPEVNVIEPHLALTAYRVVVEAIRNAVRHGKASRVAVTARYVPSAGENESLGNEVSGNHGCWLIEISDDGVGFDRGQVPQDRFGIRSMTGRAQLVGGELSIESQPGGPTRVRLQLPTETDGEMP